MNIQVKVTNDAAFRLAAACVGKTDFNAALGAIKVGNDAVLTATNGFIGMRHEDALEPHPYSDQFIRLAKRPPKTATDFIIDFEELEVTYAIKGRAKRYSIGFKHVEVGNYPDILQIIPQRAARPDVDQLGLIGFNVQYLYDMAEAIGDDRQVYLEHGTNGIYRFVTDDENLTALIAPLRYGRGPAPTGRVLRLGR